MAKEPGEFFRLILSRGRKIKDPQERHLVYLAALYLESESRHNNRQKRQDDIRQVWFMLKPLLEKNRLVTTEAKDPTLVLKMMLFLQIEVSSRKRDGR